MKAIVKISSKLIFLLLSSVLFNSEVYGVTCSNFLESSYVNSEGLNLAVKFERAVERFSPDNENITKEEIQAFGKSSSSLKSLQTLAKQGLLGRSLWLVMEELIFNSIDMEQTETVQRIERAYNQYVELEISGAHEMITYLLWMKPKNAYVNKKKIIHVLKNYSLLFSDILGRDVDLTTEADLLKYFGVSKRHELRDRHSDLENKNRNLFARIQDSLNLSEKTGSVIRDELSTYFLGQKKHTVYDYDFGFLKQSVSKDETLSLLEKLRLPQAELDLFVRDVYAVAQTYENGSTQDDYVSRSAYLLILAKASESVFGKVNLVPTNQRMDAVVARREHISKVYRSLKTKIIQSEFSRTIVEERMSNYIEKTEIVNKRIEDLESVFLELKEMSASNHKVVDEHLESLEALKVLDFDVDLTQISLELNGLELKLDALMESVLKAIRNEDITEFKRLNNRWQRLIAGKRYNLAGIDYKGVVFSKNVIDHFQKNLVLGGRYLTALSKSYVPIKKASGLRRLPTIHSDFRDIKSIRAQGKIRIVGKLIGDTIYFFHVHDSEKPYETKAIAKIIDGFHP